MRKKKEAGLELGLGLGFSYFWFHSQLCSFHVTYHINIPYPQLHDSYSCIVTFFLAFPPLPSQALKDR